MDEIIELFRLKGNDKYGISEPITQEQHAIQTYKSMKEMKGDKYECVAALLHDIGHLLLPEPIDPKTGVDDFHEVIGANHLKSMGFDERVWGPVSLHVHAKRYLCATKPYPLSRGSALSLNLQGGPMSEHEIKAFESSPHFQSAIKLRECDDSSKEVIYNYELNKVTLESLRELVESTIL
jgi:predicted HD phosphohydrolase